MEAGQTRFSYAGHGKTAGRMVEIACRTVFPEVLEGLTEAVDWAQDAVAEAGRAKQK